ncbi:uncharacterized protein LOC108032465 [Drosophila biarmipes]|uniref:uncharacterized protein LOC108032465 n=1 Tax=Drosophila biarmipes TaxID=125945 RepID=UPI0007E82C2F|nr:uncharacterized protein LOC108032465 [Drosophila biarmipes]
MSVKMSFKNNSIKSSELDPTASNRSSLLLDEEAMKQLRDHWSDYILSLPKTPFELQLAKARADRALDLVRGKQKAVVKQGPSTPKRSRRPLTDMHNSPRTTSRMKQVLETLMRPAKIKESESQYNLCPQCGLVKDSVFNHEHAESRLQKLFEQHPCLLPKGRNRKWPRYLRVL